jgi:hypothetical protein
VAPFISWQAKNIPMQLEWAMQKPGEFAGMLRGMQLLNGEGGGIPEALLPGYLKDKYNGVLDKKRDPKTGKLVYFYTTTNGVLPITDLQEIWDSHGTSLFQVLGPIFKLGIDVYTGKYGEEGDGTAGGLARGVFGKPYDVVQKLSDSAKANPTTGLQNFSLGDELLQMVGPSRVQQMAVEDRLQKAEGKNKIELGEAKGKAKRALQSWEQAKLFNYAPEELGLYEQKAQQAQVNLQRVQRRTEAERLQFERLRSRIERLHLAP